MVKSSFQDRRRIPSHPRMAKRSLMEENEYLLYWMRN
uniref:Uncharacterized protein n=1 Tax=Manihot esculenta TaxID=3983 RepID=A0A2C9VU09_MANES